MPELAEVRTVASVLKKKLIGKKVTSVKVIYPKIVEGARDINELIGHTLEDITTYGKYLIFNYGEVSVISHLRMEGKYFVKPSDDEILKHEHVIIYFGDLSLRYHDTRKFGRMCIVKTSEAGNNPALVKLAKEPFDMDADELYSHIHNKKKHMKSLLLEQEVIAGLGNIYADEVLFASKINPLRLGESVTLEECNRIINSARDILSLAIKEGGTTIRSYTSSLGVTGNYQNFLKVHKKEGELCTCGCKIEKIKVGGRSTYFCPNCQK